EFSPEVLLIEYVNLLKARVKDPGDIVLIDCSSRVGYEKDLISVRCYEDRSRKRLYGEGNVNIRGDLRKQNLRIIGLFNMAFAASNIRKGVRYDEMNDFERKLIQFIKDQCREITGIDVEEEKLLEFIKNLPPAKPVPVDSLRDYWKTAVQQFKRAA
ncbi:MAG: hypothetical protein PVH45_02385, partial [Candidatus Omnitrophota bacterium]